MDALIMDVRYAVRQLAKNPGLTAVAALSLALGIGVNTALYGIGERVLFRAPPVAEPERLVSVIDGAPESGRVTDNSYRDYAAYRDGVRPLAGVVASTGRTASLGTGDAPRRVTVAVVTPNYFRMLGIAPALGRDFADLRDVEGEPDAVAVLSDGLWRRAFGADPGAVGRTIMINGSAFTVVGVVPRAFYGLDLAAPADLWVPLRAERLLETSGGFDAGVVFSVAESRQRWLRVTARLAPGATLAQAEAAVRAVRRRIDPPPAGAPAATQVSLLPLERTLTNAAGTDLASFVWLLLGVVGLTLLIACANLATLLLARGAARAQEIGIRFALGASRARLVRQLVTESAILSFVGAGAGLLVSAWTLDLLRPFVLPGGVAVAELAAGGARVLPVALVLALITSALVGLTPALAVTRRGAARVLTSRRGADTAEHAKLRGWLVGAQVALALVLLTGAGLFARSLRNALDLDVGFTIAGVGLASFNLGEQRYSPDRAQLFYRQLRDGASTLPGVRAAAVARRVPVNPAGSRTTIAPAEHPDRPAGEISFNLVSPGFFATLGIPLVRGRDFGEGDVEGAPPVVIVNEALASLVWPNESPLGKRIIFGPGETAREVVGVARNGLYRSLRETGLPYFYVPIAQGMDLGGLREMTLLVRAERDAADALPTAVGLIHSLDPHLPVYRVASMAEHQRDLLMPQRMGTTLLGLLSLLGMTLAAVGIYGVVAYAVTRRTHEIGIRVALGARPGDVVRLAVRSGLAPVISGVAVGALLSLLGARLAAGFMFGIRATDPLTFVAAAALLIATGVVAALVPARRAARIEPLVALRAE